jgi:hypothetical protein
MLNSYSPRVLNYVLLARIIINPTGLSYYLLIWKKNALSVKNAFLQHPSSTLSHAIAINSTWSFTINRKTSSKYANMFAENNTKSKLNTHVQLISSELISCKSSRFSMLFLNSCTVHNSLHGVDCWIIPAKATKIPTKSNIVCAGSIFL